MLPNAEGEISDQTRRPAEPIASPAAEVASLQSAERPNSRFVNAQEDGSSVKMPMIVRMTILAAITLRPASTTTPMTSRITFCFTAERT